MKQLFTTLWNHRAYNALFENPQRLAATGEWIRVQLNSLHPWTKGSQKGFSRHTFLARLNAYGYTGVGAGASNLYGEAIQMAISEAYERLIYFAMRGPLDIKTSNGFAAHPKRETAVQNACGEALERDATLVHWLTKTPMLSLPLHHETMQGEAVERSLAGTPFTPKYLLLSTRGWISTLTVIAEERWGESAIVAHGSGNSLDHALMRTLVELERQAATARELVPRIHPFFTREQLGRAAWIEGEKLSWQTARRMWRAISREMIAKMKIQDLAEGNLQVVRASSPHLQDLYFGQTKIEELNLPRLETRDINLDPHFVA